MLLIKRGPLESPDEYLLKRNHWNHPMHTYQKGTTGIPKWILIKRGPLESPSHGSRAVARLLKNSTVAFSPARGSVHHYPLKLIPTSSSVMSRNGQIFFFVSRNVTGCAECHGMSGIVHCHMSHVSCHLPQFTCHLSLRGKDVRSNLQKPEGMSRFFFSYQ